MNNPSILDYDFITAAEKLLHVDRERITAALETVGVDQLLDLLDALQNGHIESVRHLLKLDHIAGNDHRMEAAAPLRALETVTEDHFVAEGFNYSTSLTSDRARDALVDWLDDQGFAYEMAPEGRVLVKCDKREAAYRVDTVVSNIKRKYSSKPFVRDGKLVHQPALEDSDVRKKKKGLKLPRAAATLELVTNPLFKGKVEKSMNEKQQKGDKWDRKAKHRKSSLGEDGGAADLRFAPGDPVQVEGTRATVKISNGPGDTIGVLIDGELQMVDKKSVKRVDESVIGLSMMPGLKRMQELAGIRMTEAPLDLIGAHTDPVPGAEMDAGMDAGIDGMDSVAAPVGAEMDSDIGVGMDEPVGMGDPMAGGVDVAPPMGLDAGIGGDDMGMDDGMGIDAPVAAAPAPLPASPIDAVGAPADSNAYGEIDNALNNIQRLLADVKVHEYKGLVARLRDLSNQAGQMGRDYLGEQAKKKAAEIAKAKKTKKPVAETSAPRTLKDYLKK